jgi:hypothetical protein
MTEIDDYSRFTEENERCTESKKISVLPERIGIPIESPSQRSLG